MLQALTGTVNEKVSAGRGGSLSPMRAANRMVLNMFKRYCGTIMDILTNSVTCDGSVERHERLHALL